jgi:MFS family permease
VIGEFRQNWRPLLGAFLGIGSALSLNTFILSTFAPYFLAEFGWTKQDWALLSVVQLAVMVAIPVAGRMADVLGVWRTAAIGATTFPAFLVMIAFMDGSIGTFFAIYIAQTVIGATTTATVYSRVVAQAFRINRGLALGVCGAGAPLIGALGSPLASAFVQTHGFTAGYLAVAAFCTVCSVLTLWLLWGVEGPRPVREPAQRGSNDYRQIARMPVFWLMLGATFLANLPFSLATTQIKLVAGEQGLDDADAALMVSALGIAAVLGRVIFGVAVDRLPPHRVVAFAFALPVLGLSLLASPLDSFAVVFAAIMLIGIAFGAEADVVPVLVVRWFGLRVFSTVLGLLTAAMGAAMALGNGLLAAMLATTGSFDAYLIAAAGSAALGSLLFLTLGQERFRPAPLAA